MTTFKCPTELREILLPESKDVYHEDIVITGGPKRLEIRFAAMYSAPPLSFNLLNKLAEHFGTVHITVDRDGVDRSGCESCDWGSSYGHVITILNASRNAGLEIDPEVRR